MNWQLITSDKRNPQEIMDLDARLLDQMSIQSQPILHLYEWDSPSLTHGYFVDPSLHLNKDNLHKYNLKIAKRPTGGGIIFHVSDFAFSILIPSSHPHFSLNTLENYAYINRLVAKAISPLLNELEPLRPIELLIKEKECNFPQCSSFCMAKPTQYDLIVNGKKVGGAAQRKTKAGFLHQGSISLGLPPMTLLQDVLKHPESIVDFNAAK